MKIIKAKINDFITTDDRCCIIGNFDGIHLGHQKLMKCLENQKNLKSLITFNKHRLNNPHYLTPFEEKIDYIKNNYQIDEIIVFDYSQTFIQNSREEFVEFLLKNNVKKIICQEDFRFGRNRLGNPSFLKDFMDVELIETVYQDNQKVSSTLIRKYLSEGYIQKANILLGRKYSIKGLVIEGLKIGRTIGFPTINIDYKDYYLPKNGVYAVKVILKNKEYLSMANIGLNPTVSENQIIKFEVHIFDFQEYVYNEPVEISFLDYIREEKKFKDLYALKYELQRNKQKILDLYSK